jgi:DNA polymerase III epsilon subunit-like protein
MNNRVFIVTDTETTGTDPSLGHEITQLSAIALNPITLEEHHVGRFNMFIKPKNPERADPKAIQIAKKAYDTAMREGLDTKTVLTRYHDWVQKSNPSGKAMTLPLFTGFNAGFDWDMISYYMYKEGVWKTKEDSPFAGMKYDVWQSCFNIFESCPDTKLMNLGAMLEKFGLQRASNDHDALEDIVLTCNLLRRIQFFNRRNRTKMKLLSTEESLELMKKEITEQKRYE